MVRSHIVFTDRSHGDFAVGPGDPTDAVVTRRRRVVDLPWSWLHQVHGGAVAVVAWPGGRAGEDGDALVTAVPGAVLAVQVADCAPVALTSPEGVVAAVHAGWRGVEAGVVERAVDTMRSLGARDITAVLGPCIRAECYEFGRDDLDRLATRLGRSIEGRTASGRPALDLPAAVRVALDRAGVAALDDTGVCTACSPDHFSHRARGDTSRHVLAVWREP